MVFSFRMKFSVLISVYSKEKPLNLRQSLDSIFDQTRHADEVVLVEDGPLTPELYAVLDEFSSLHPEMKRIPLAKNSGLGHALDIGITHCSHELIARMDSDDICHKNRFEKQVRLMEENPDIDICGTWLQEFEDDISNFGVIKKVPSTHREISQYIKTRNPLNHPTVIFRKHAIVDAGGYQQFPLFEDYYLWARMMVTGSKFANIPECLVFFRVSSQLYKRRGGLRYAKDSVLFQRALYNLGLISPFSAIKSSIIRSIIYLLPNTLRTFVYKNFLRN